MALRVTSIFAPVLRVYADLGGNREGALIITATNNGPAGVRALNAHLHGDHADRADLAEMKGFLGNWFSAGDPVVFLRNRYDLGLFNGLLGRVACIHSDARSADVVFDGDDEAKRIATEDLIDLTLAYAITCHKAQGSQSARIVIPIYPSRVLDAAWLYTAVTRSERQAVLIGNLEILLDALQRPTAAERRLVGFSW